MRKLTLVVLVIGILCIPRAVQSGDIKILPFPKDIIYISSDLAHTAVFSRERTRFGPTDLAIANPEWPSSPATYFEKDNGTRCLSIGTGETSSQYAVKRPIKSGDKYKCVRTSFRVIRCFDNCKAAIIEIDQPLSGNREGTLKGSMYVDNCRGVIILGVVSDLSQGIPLNAEWLRGEVGILADPAYPNC